MTNLKNIAEVAKWKRQLSGEFINDEIWFRNDKIINDCTRKAKLKTLIRWSDDKVVAISCSRSHLLFSIL